MKYYTRENTMGEPGILDTFPAFETFWGKAKHLPLERQIDLWEREYMAPWPELLEKQKEGYEEEGFNWRHIARTNVFPYLDERLPRMRALHSELLQTLPETWKRTRRVLGIRFPVRFVIHVGIGHGNWATTYGGKPACLIGLENAAANHDGTDGWARRVVAHEVGHLAHQEWREKGGKDHAGPWWTLYEEGFATYTEREIEPKAFLLRTGKKDWLPWCDDHRGWLAKKFLKDVSARRSVRPFFGSWFNVRGQIETGYYLGSEIIKEWAKTLPLKEIAVILETVIRERAQTTLRGFAEGA